MTLEEQILAAANGQTEGQTAQPLKVDLGSGQVLEFQSPEELSASLRTALTQVNGEVTSLKTKLAEYEATVNSQNSQYVTSDEDTRDKFNMDTFLEKMRANPVEGFNYVDQFRENPYKEKLAELEGFKQEYEVQKFLQAHPYFPGGDYAKVLDATRQELKLPFNKLGLETAMQHAVQNNRMPDFRTQYALQNQQAQFLQYLQQNGIQLPGQPQQTPYNNVTPPNQVIQSQGFQNNPYQGGGIPTVPRQQTQQSNNVLEAAENMSLEDLTKVLKQFGAL